MKHKRILISGAGVAGLSLAYWLRHYGFSPTVIEQAPSLRIGGYKVDIRGAALDVISRMKLHKEISAHKLHIQGATIVDRVGNTITEMSGETFNLRTGQDLEIMRGDLCQILLEHTKDIDVIFGDSIASLTQHPDGVDVRFDKAKQDTFDLVIGADGLHSRVRQLVFGPETHFAKDLGLYICIYTVPNHLHLDGWEMEYSDSHKLVNMYSVKHDLPAKAAFLFSSKPVDFALRNKQKIEELLITIYSDIGWETQKLLNALPDAADLYFDSISQITMPKWSKGRVGLVGDAGFAASPVSGQGTSVALVSSYVLAGELASNSYDTAFASYEKELRSYVKANQKLGEVFAKKMQGESYNKTLVWLHDQLMQIVPKQWVHFLTQRSVDRVERAANAIKLKSYPS